MFVWVINSQEHCWVCYVLITFDGLYMNFTMYFVDVYLIPLTLHFIFDFNKYIGKDYGFDLWEIMVAIMNDDNFLIYF
jgi:hypothetical protein